MQELKLIPPTDPRVQTAIAPFTDDMLKEHNIKDREELTVAMFDCMKKFHGIGLTANQVGLPFNMFVAGGHPSIENGKAVAFAIFNLQARGEMFVTHNDPVYEGMIVGLSSKSGDLEINVLKGKISLSIN